MTAVLQVLQSTVFQQKPTQPAERLPSELSYTVAAGSRFELKDVTPASPSYLQVDLVEPLQGFSTWFVFAEHVRVLAAETDPLETARDREAIFQFFLDTERQEGSDCNRLSFLDRGLQTFPNAAEIAHYPERLSQRPDGQTVVSPGDRVTLSRSDHTISFKPYFQVGVVPPIDQTGLEFLHPDIKEACLCIGSLVNGEMLTHWLGRNALTTAQFWSATKIVPILHVLCQANHRSPQTPIQDCWICDPQDPTKNITFIDAAIDIMSYRKDDIANDIMTSNAMAGMMKRFSRLPDLEQWFRGVTGNPYLAFRGYYGATPFINNPQLTTQTEVILAAEQESERGDNLVTAYDLTRLITMVGWHNYLPEAARLPEAQWHSLQTVIQTMGYDTARYVEAAIAQLGLGATIREPVILSKVGFGGSDLRDRTELTYTCLVQLIDDRPQVKGKPSVLRAFAMTLRSATQKFNAAGQRDLDEEACYLDARMAAEVTEILRRVIVQELV